MKCNVGGVERPIRIGVGIVGILIGFFADLSTGMAATALTVGALLLLTGAVRFCPLFMLFGISTCAPSSGMQK